MLDIDSEWIAPLAASVDVPSVSEAAVPVAVSASFIEGACGINHWLSRKDMDPRSTSASARLASALSANHAI